MRLKQVAPRVYLVTFKDRHTLGMTFLRCQEYYESPKFRGEFFKLFDYIDWYSRYQSKDGTFSYTKDLLGFNVPGHVVHTVVNMLHDSVYDLSTKYDEIMYKIYKKLYTRHGENFYLIGVSEEGSKGGQVIEHETAHGLYSTDIKYRVEMSILLKSLPRDIKKRLHRLLSKMGYHRHTQLDEIHAYLSTGMTRDMKKVRGIRIWANKFQKLFKQLKQESKENE